jgi:hypothetical protein
MTILLLMKDEGPVQCTGENATVLQHFCFKSSQNSAHINYKIINCLNINNTQYVHWTSFFKQSPQSFSIHIYQISFILLKLSFYPYSTLLPILLAPKWYPVFAFLIFQLLSIPSITILIHRLNPYPPGSALMVLFSPGSPLIFPLSHVPL